MKTKTIDKRIKTKSEGIFYKEIIKRVIDSEGKEKVTKDFDRIYIVRYKDNGRERYVRIGKKSDGITEAYCKVKRSEFVTLANNEELPTQIKRRDKKEIVSFDDLAAEYFEDRKEHFVNAEGFEEFELRGSNRRQEGKYNLHLKPKLGSKNIEELSENDFKEVVVKKLQKEGKAGKTINGVIDLARAIINAGIKSRKLKIYNPTVGIGISKKKADKKRDRFLSVSEVKKLLEAVSEDDVLNRFVLMALSTGARLNTVLSIRVKDIDLAHKKVKLQDFKTDSDYTGFIDTDKHLELIAGAIKDKKPNDIYISMPERTLTRKLKKVFDELFNVGLEVRDFENRVVVHTLRHTFASQLVLNGVAIYTVQKLMNHSDIKMTERYAKLAPEAGAKAVRGLYE